MKFFTGLLAGLIVGAGLMAFAGEPKEKVAIEARKVDLVELQARVAGLEKRMGPDFGDTVHRIEKRVRSNEQSIGRVENDVRGLKTDVSRIRR